MGVVVSVVVVARNEERNIGPCLDSLLSQDYPRDRYEVIVVDGGSTDRTADRARERAVDLVSSDRAVIGYQRNLGVKRARGRFVAFTDADCVADREWLRRLTEAMEGRGAGVAAVGGPNLVFESDPGFARVVGHMQETLFGSGGSAQSRAMDSARRVNSLPNCNAMYERSVLESERYDDSIGCGDDLDLNYRLARKGHAFWFVPGAAVRHHRPAGFASFARKMWCYGEAAGRVSRKNRGLVRWYAPAASLAVVAVLAAYPVVRFVPFAGYVYLAGAVLYLGLLGAATVRVAARLRSPLSLLTVVLLPLQHLAYGTGFLKGMVA